jgi:hypothetical protein
MTKKFSDIDLMKFVDGELENKELSMDILGAVIKGDKKLQARLDVFVKTREVLTKKGNTMLLNILTQEKI